MPVYQSWRLLNKHNIRSHTPVFQKQTVYKIVLLIWNLILKRCFFFVYFIMNEYVSLFRLSSSVREHHSNSIDWTLRSSARVDPVTTTDVVAPSPWTIFGCQNGMVHTQLLLLFLCGWNVIGLIIVLHAGLRLFKEAKERDSLGRVSIFLLS